MKHSTLAALAAATLAVGAVSYPVLAADATRTVDVKCDKCDVKTVTGKSACATCEGVTSSGHAILLIDKEGTRWVLLGSGKAYEAAHDLRKQGKTMTATLCSAPVVKKDADGKNYNEVKVSDIKIDA